MKNIIDKYLNLALGPKFTDNLNDSDYIIEDKDYYVTVDIDTKKQAYEAKIKGKITGNYSTFSIHELSDIDEDKKYFRKTMVEFIKSEDTVRYEKIVEDRINLYDFENTLIRSKLERKVNEMDNFKVAEKDINNSLLDDIKIIKPLHKMKRL